jgi:mycofactocin precursor
MTRATIRTNPAGRPDGGPVELDSTTDTIPADADSIVDADQDLIEDELLVEEISIDGMCGVY